jgi:hypothetical protein
MKQLTISILFVFPMLCFGQNIITDDINNFWIAYDKIVVEKDSLKQLNLIKTLYIDKGTPGLNGIMKARRYSAEEYVFAINKYPKFWTSIRTNTIKSHQFSKEIQSGVEKLKMIYPNLKPVNIYFEIGILRTGGTTIDGMSLIGSEVALADSTIITSEFDDQYPHLRNYFDTNPIHGVVFTNIHEYIHTQQKETIGNTLLSQTIMEGVAEFLAEIALDTKSPNPQIKYGYQNEAKIKQEFEKEMFSPNSYNWIMNSANNQFGMRDLGYFVGHAICKKYYDASNNKTEAIKEMIEMDYNNEKELIKFVERSKYFDKPLSYYKNKLDEISPKIVSIKPFQNGSKKVEAGVIQISITFSQEMNPETRSFDFGPLGEEYIYEFRKIIGWSNDNKTFSFEVYVEPNRTYQFVVGSSFRNTEEIRLKPYLVEFKTKDSKQ